MPRTVRFFVGVAIAALATLLVLEFAQSISGRRVPRLVERILSLEFVPASLRNAECRSGATTDVIATCVFEISQSDFPVLLRGRAFNKEVVSGTNHDFAAYAIGQAFSASARYLVQPAEFKHGGYVSLVANAERTRVQVEIYQE
ncbi:hypothetical protein RGCCGE502_23575 [Rhizobium grahamii CCGE 502]|uniref:Uncharacterized protein n=1 Tax=Rhizobium grahamii CCGE 502 TaxID=990285 RepID=S3I948_9HYPH|nr:hypothetical protein RGCCGE502_23575 [Rhizobium grahamii CCGE 502]